MAWLRLFLSSIMPLKRLWEFHGFWLNREAVRVLLIMAAIIYVIDSEYDKLALPLFVLRCVVDGWIVREIAGRWFDWLHEYSRGFNFFTRRDIVKWAWAASIIHFWLPTCSYAIWAMLFVLLLILLLEVVVDEVCVMLHAHDPTPSIGPLTTAYWHLVAVLKSTNNGYNSGQFVVAKLCESISGEDPFWPNHVSSLSVVEFRRRNMIWTTIILWRLSFLDGEKKKIHEFNHVNHIFDCKLFKRSNRFWYTIGFESNGVVFVPYGDQVYVYDFKARLANVFDMPWKINVCTLQAMKRVRRLVKADGSIEGYQIRCISGGWTECNCHPDDESEFRACVGSKVLDLGNKSQVPCQEFILFGTPDPWGKQLREIQNSRGMFGLQLYGQQADDGPVMLFDDAKNEFVFFPNYDAYRGSDRRCDALAYTPPPSASLAPVNKRSNLSPAILNDQECVQLFGNDSLFRTEFTPPSLKYAAAKALFRVRPNLRREMTAERFRALTGIDGMEHHFGQ